jgi:hypothetical protein
MRTRCTWISAAFVITAGATTGDSMLLARTRADVMFADQSPEGPQSPSPQISIINIERAYGTLEFRGHVERVDLGEEYEFRTHIAITFRPSERVNRTPVADLRVCQLVATVVREPGLPVEVLHRETQTIAVLLSEDGETKPMPDLVFRCPSWSRGKRLTWAWV